MKNKKDLIQLILLAIIAISLVIGLVFMTFHLKENSSNKVPSQDGNIQNKVEDESEKEIENNASSNETSTPVPNQPSLSPPNSISIPNNTAVPNPTPNSTPDASVTKEEQVLSYFENLSSSVSTYNNEENPTFREKAKNAFTTVVDFLFYDSQIHGVAFKELTTSAKLKITKIALKIDHTIDSYFPNYKTTIKTQMQDLKGKAALLYLEITAKLCDAVGEHACTEARVDFKNMKESFGFTWDIIKSAATSSYQSLKTILNEWYQSIK